MCGFPSLDVAPMDQAIPKEMWVRWDGLQTHNPTTQQVQPVQSVSTANDIDKWGFCVIKRWFIGCTGCTLQTLYAWLMRGFGIGMVGILIYRVLLGTQAMILI